MAVLTEYAHGQFNWVDLAAGDMAEAKAFYTGLFGWDCVDQDTQGGPPYAIFEIGGKRLAGLGQLSDDMRSQGVPPAWNSYVNVADLESTISKCQELGGAAPMPVCKIMDAGSMAMILDPGGAPLFLWQADKHLGAGLVNEVGTHCWNELATRDLKQSKNFFGKLFGWTFEANDDSPAPYYNIKLGNIKLDGGKHGDRLNGGMMQMTEEWGDAPPHWTVYFHVADIHEYEKRLEQLGGQKIHGPFETPVGPIIVSADPQGAAFNAIQMTVAPD
ncbi:MAG: VOC family protein [Planctomycetota bacterium]